MRLSVPLERPAARTVREPARDVPVHDEVDVLVVGGGPAGIGAALAAARSGMSTLVVERYGCLGGIWTAGLLNPYFDASTKGGVPAEIIARLDEAGGASAVRDWSQDVYGIEAVVFNYETMKHVLDRMALEAGVELLLYTHAVGAIVDEDQVRGVIVENKSGRSAILAASVVDCTGDGDVAYHAGCGFEMGRPSDGLTQPMTLMFKVAGFDFRQRPDNMLYDALLRLHAEDDILADVPFRFPWGIPEAGHPGSAVMMWTHVHGADGTSADDLTRAVLEGRRQAQRCMELLRAGRDVFGDVRLVETAMQIGVRETRRILGEYHLEEEDLKSGRMFEDTICRVTFGVDIHHPDGSGQGGYAVQPYGIPYRCLVPKDIDRLLVAGRCISGSFEAHASYRVTGNCVAMGEAAGVAAAQSVAAGLAPRQVDGRLVRRLLAERGANVETPAEP